MKVTRQKRCASDVAQRSMTCRILHQLEVGEDPSGWIKVDLSQVAADTTNQFFGRRRTGTAENTIRTHFLQVVVLSMHQNGRDTHIRQVKVFGPRTSSRGCCATT